MVDLILQCAISGILMGGVYVLIAVGLTLVFGVMHIANFAHGAILMLGMYISYWLFTLMHIDPYLGAVICAAVLFILGAGIQRFLFRHVIDAHHYMQILLAFGVLVVIENFALFVWGADFRAVRVDYSLSSIGIGNVAISVSRLIAFGSAVLLTVILYLFLMKTAVGLAIRATAEDLQGARLVGINIEKIHVIVFGIGCACAGFAGALLTPFYYISPYVGNVFLMLAFVVVVLGGMGSFHGALIGGIIIGLVEAMGALFIPGTMKQFVIYFMFVVILLVKPTGLFGGREE